MRRDSAVNKFKSGYNCAQSVVFTYGDKIGISENDLLKMANGFGAGMGRMQKSCGALTGGIIVLGLLYGRGEGGEKTDQEKCYSKVRELIESFEKKHKTSECIELLDKCPLGLPEGQERFKNEKMIEWCWGYVASVVDILEEIIGREERK